MDGLDGWMDFESHKLSWLNGCLCHPVSSGCLRHPALIGWIDGWVDGWLDGVMDEWMGRWMVG